MHLCHNHPPLFRLITEFIKETGGSYRCPVPVRIRRCGLWLKTHRWFLFCGVHGCSLIRALSDNEQSSLTWLRRGEEAKKMCKESKAGGKSCTDPRKIKSFSAAGCLVCDFNFLVFHTKFFTFNCDRLFLWCQVEQL